eukprot:Hpha_TRINITY_DN19430_c0_g1::TRINITY_DN19430_c0_g1_i1::g.45717::m.45717/K04459/DUSP, MKP; dual specificity MAP kinase phosphatase
MQDIHSVELPGYKLILQSEVFRARRVSQPQICTPTTCSFTDQLPSPASASPGPTPEDLEAPILTPRDRIDGVACSRDALSDILNAPTFGAKRFNMQMAMMFHRCRKSNAPRVSNNDGPWELIPSLLLGSQPRSQDRDAEKLAKLGVTHVVRVSEEVLEGQEISLAEHGIDFVHVNAADEYGSLILPNSLLSVLDYYREAVKCGGRVLIHCHAGLNRSVTLCVALLMVEHGMELGEAVTLCSKVRRDTVLMNESFRQELMDLAEGIALHADEAH